MAGIGKSQIEPDGTVHNICKGTRCSEHGEFHHRRGFYDDDPHGLFPILLAAIEMDPLKAVANSPRPDHELAAPKPVTMVAC